MKFLFAKRHYLYIITYTEENFYCFRKLFLHFTEKAKIVIILVVLLSF